MISEDGGIDVVPELALQVSRSLIESKLKTVLELVSGSLFRANVFYYINWLDRHRFYLLQPDCDLLNSIVPALEFRAKEESTYSVGDPYCQVGTGSGI